MLHSASKNYAQRLHILDSVQLAVELLPISALRNLGAFRSGIRFGSRSFHGQML